jgi:hypothetical protein
VTYPAQNPFIPPHILVTLQRTLQENRGRSEKKGKEKRRKRRRNKRGERNKRENP